MSFNNQMKTVRFVSLIVAVEHFEKQWIKSLISKQDPLPFNNFALRLSLEQADQMSQHTCQVARVVGPLGRFPAAMYLT